MFKRKQILMATLSGVILVLSACAPAQATSIPVTGETAAPQEPAASPVVPNQAVLNAQQWLAAQLNVAADQIQIMDFGPEEWTDSCLGLGRLNESCLQAITPGWRVVFEFNGITYEVRTDETASVIRLAPSEGASENSLENTHWSLVSFGSLNEGQAVIEGSSITLMLANGQAGGYGGCNSYGGTYQVDGDTLSFGEITRTERACVDEKVTQQESQYFQVLESVARFERTDNLLILSDENGNAILTFETPMTIVPAPQ